MFQLFESSDTGYSSYGRTTTEVCIVLVLPLQGLRALRRIGVDRTREKTGPQAPLGALPLHRRICRACSFLAVCVPHQFLLQTRAGNISFMPPCLFYMELMQVDAVSFMPPFLRRM